MFWVYRCVYWLGERRTEGDLWFIMYWRVFLVNSLVLVLSNISSYSVFTSLHFILNAFYLILFSKNIYLFFTFNIWLHVFWKFFYCFTFRSSASEDDKEDSAWEPQKKVPRSRKLPVSKESKLKRAPRVKKNTLQTKDGSEGVAVKEELVGALAG